MSYPPQGTGGSVDISTLATLANQTTLLDRLTAARAGYMDSLNRGRPNMIFPSGPPQDVTIPAVAADLDFPSVVVDTLPSGLSVAKVDFVVVFGTLEDTSAAINYIAAASKTIRVKVSTGAWGVDDIVALTFGNAGLNVPASGRIGAPPLFGATDIKSVITGNATYNFRSEQTNRSQGVTAHAASIILRDVSSIIRVWFN